VAKNRRGRRGGRSPKHDSLSRDERAAYGGEAGFAPSQEMIRCGSCRDFELSPPSLYDSSTSAGKRLNPRRSFGCEECGGWGWVPAHGKQRLDPMMIPKRG